MSQTRVMNPLSLGVIESGLNRVLRQDPDSPARLEPLIGKTICIDSWLKDDHSVFVTFSDDGIHLATDHPGTVDAEVCGGPFSFARAAMNPSDRSAFNDGSLQVEGDATLVQAFSDLLRYYRPNWQQRLSPLIGDALTWRIESSIDTLGRVRKRASEKTFTDGGDYLREEIRLAASRGSVEDFADAVDEIVADVDRLEQRIIRLESDS